MVDDDGWDGMVEPSKHQAHTRVDQTYYYQAPGGGPWSDSRGLATHRTQTSKSRPCLESWLQRTRRDELAVGEEADWRVGLAGVD